MTSIRRDRVLVVDDEPSLRVTLADVLRGEGYQVRLAASGEEALELAEAEEFHTFLVDVRMPGVGGLETFRRLRRRNAGARVILMSAGAPASTARSALEEGAVAVLRKPLDLHLVLRLVADVQAASVLLVQEDAVASGLQQGLGERGYAVTLARPPRAALELIARIHFELVFLDAGTRSIDALELYHALRQKAPSAIVVMLAEGAEEERTARQAVRETAYTSLAKPLDGIELDHLVRRLQAQMASNELHKPEQA